MGLKELKKEYKKISDKKESDFIDYINIVKPKKGWHAEKSSDKDDKERHIDGYLSSKTLTRSYDFKQKKSICTRGPKSGTHTWLELDNGYKNGGWLYGYEDYVIMPYDAIEGKEYVIFQRESLLMFTLKQTKNQCVLEKPIKESEVKCYQKYYRTGKTDCIVLAPIEDMIKECMHSFV